MNVFSDPKRKHILSPRGLLQHPLHGTNTCSIAQLDELNASFHLLLANTVKAVQQGLACEDLLFLFCSEFFTEDHEALLECGIVELLRDRLSSNSENRIPHRILCILAVNLSFYLPICNSA